MTDRAGERGSPRDFARGVVSEWRLPLSPDAFLEAFTHWPNSARTLSDDMDAQLINDEGQPVTLHAFAAIGVELQQIYRKLESRDLAAGSAAARRLFS